MTIAFHHRSGKRVKHARSTLPGTKFAPVSLLISFIIFAPCLLAEIASSEHPQEIRERIDQLESSLENEEIKFDSAREEIIEIERRLHRARQEKEKFRLQLEGKSDRIVALRAKRDGLNRAYAATAEVIKKTLVAQFMLWRQPKLKLLLNNTNITELQRHLKYYDYIATANNKILRKQTSQLEQLADVERALKLEAAKLRYTRAQAEQHFAALTDTLERRQRIAASLERLLKEDAQALGLLRNDENQLTKLVDDVTDNVLSTPPVSMPFAGLKGALSWPTAGPIAKAPGGAMHEGGAKWSGVIIESGPGSEVAAVADGQIAFADWFRNLGLLVIIDHGDGYMSLYGHNQELYKESGESVAAGEIVATVGDTGGQSTSGLYFEIRQDGLPEDPRQWCKK